MTELDVIVQRLDTMQDTLKDHGETLKLLAETSTAMQLQQKDISSLNAQCVALWEKINEMAGPDGSVTKIKDHQAQCPKAEMHRTFRWMWSAISFELILIGWMIYKVTV